MIEREIPEEYIASAVSQPDIVVSDKNDPELKHYLKKIPERGNRIIRVVININVDPQRVITVYFDRTMRGKI